MKTAVIFSRVSSEGDRQSTTRQIEDLKKFADANSMAVTQIYQEHISGAKTIEEGTRRVEENLDTSVPDKVKAKGKEFRKWVGTTLTGAKKAGFAEEKATAECLNNIGVLYNVWPTAQTKLDGPKNIAVFDASNIRIVKREQIEITEEKGKWVLVSRKEV